MPLAGAVIETNPHVVSMILSDNVIDILLLIGVLNVY